MVAVVFCKTRRKFKGKNSETEIVHTPILFEMNGFSSADQMYYKHILPIWIWLIHNQPILDKSEKNFIKNCLPQPVLVYRHCPKSHDKIPYFLYWSIITITKYSH